MNAKSAMNAMHGRHGTREKHGTHARREKHGMSEKNAGQSSSVHSLFSAIQVLTAVSCLCRVQPPERYLLQMAMG